MTKRTIYIYAAIWTLLTAGIAIFNNGAPPAIIISTATMWFWLGRLSKTPEWWTDEDLGRCPDNDQKWGR